MAIRLATVAAFGINTLIFKVGVGGGLGLAVAGSFGFDATKTVQSAEALSGLRIAFAWLPLFFRSSVRFSSS